MDPTEKMDLTPEQVRVAMNLTPGITEATIKPFLPSEWNVHSNFPLLNCDITYLPPDTNEHKKILKLVEAKAFGGKEITAIHRVENPYLYSMFLLKKAELQVRYGECSEYRLLHGTQNIFMADIVLDNLNWRKGSKYTPYNQGVYFTNCCRQANPHTNYTLLVVKVLVASPLKQDEFEDSRAQRMLSRWKHYSLHPDPKRMDPHKIAEHFDKSFAEEEKIEKGPKGLPRNNHDTVISHDDLITVKYDDHCFYPEYVISLCPSDWE